MEAIKRLAEIKDHKLILDLPKSFDHAKVEVIILPYEPPEATSGADTPSWQQDFMSVSCWEEEDGEETVRSWPLKAF